MFVQYEKINKDLKKIKFIILKISILDFKPGNINIKLAASAPK
jgi:hypothetical protein